MPPRAELPLGVFDSGLGGLTVVGALGRVLPRERFLYLGDTARVPYGTRSAETIVRYSRGCARVLVERGIKALIIACNTASAVSVEMLRAELDLPVLGVIEPGAQAAARAAEQNAEQHGVLAKIGVLGTQGTIASGAYPRAVSQISSRLEVVGQAAPLLVPLVEEGWTEGEVPRLAVRRYLTPLIEAGAGVIVLGCTHYPLLRGLIEQEAAALAGRRVPVVDSAHATAAQVEDWIEQGRIEAAPPGEAALLNELLVTDLPASFEAVAGRFLDGTLPPVTQIDLTSG